MSNSPQSELARLVVAIHTTNHAWKLAQTWGESFHALADSLVDRKARLQTELLRQHHDRAYLQRDLIGETEAGEELFGILLDPPEPYRDAAHLPVRVAKTYLSEAEIQRFTREPSNDARAVTEPDNPFGSYSNDRAKPNPVSESTAVDSPDRADTEPTI